MIYLTSLAALDDVMRDGMLRPGDRIYVPASMLDALDPEGRRRLVESAAAADARVEALTDGSDRIAIFGEIEPPASRPSGEVVVQLDDGPARPELRRRR